MRILEIEEATLRYLALCLMWVIAIGGVDSVVAGDESSLQGEDIILKTAYGTTFDAYISGSKTADKGILLFHGDGGFDEGVRRWADRFAEQGYRVVVADLFDGRRSNEREFIKLIPRQIDPVWVDANVDATLSYLLDQPGRRLSAVGWGFGAEQALRVSLKHPDYISVAVVY
ncbi:MAG: hypothetical protein GXP10_02995, partial [Gammaproteobacteria bacterium]|nr:hypothetical protein [Gammaproteobacteria bacterium]